jgi:hypothetical protein
MNPLAYRPREVRAYPALALPGRTFKVYGIVAEPARAARMPAAAMLADAIASLSTATDRDGSHGLGFVILHLAQDGDYLLVSDWVDANMLRHHVYQCRVTDHGITALRSLASSGIIACVWELEIMKFERDAWVRTVLGPGVLDDAARTAYLGATCEGWR